VNSTDAIILVEHYLDGADFRDRWGDRLRGMEAIAALARHIPAELEKLEDEFFCGKLAPEEYVSGIRGLIGKAKGVEFLNRLDKELAAIREGLSA
jgi:hypothetical protein